MWGLKRIFSEPLTLQVIGSRWWTGVDSLREQEKPEARKMPENAAESHQSAATLPGRRGLPSNRMKQGSCFLARFVGHDLEDSTLYCRKTSRQNKRFFSFQARNA